MIIDNEISNFFKTPGFGQNDFAKEVYSLIPEKGDCRFFELDDKNKETYKKLFNLGTRVENKESSTESNKVTSSSTVGKGEYMLPVIYKDVRKNISKGDDTMVVDPEPFANQNNVQIEVKTAGSPFKFVKDCVPEVSYNEKNEDIFKECIARALVAYIKSRTFDAVKYKSILLLIFDNKQDSNDYTGFLCLNCGQVIKGSNSIDDEQLYKTFMNLIKIVDSNTNVKEMKYSDNSSKEGGFCIGTDGEKILVKLSNRFYKQNENNSKILNFGNFVLNENL